MKIFWPLSLLWPNLHLYLYPFQPPTLTLHLAPVEVEVEKPSQDRNTTIILGGGIIGLSTAYYMINDQRESSSGSVPKVVILDSASSLFAGASGGSAGIVGNYAFASEVAELGSLSWELFKGLNIFKCLEVVRIGIGAKSL